MSASFNRLKLLASSDHNALKALAMSALIVSHETL